MRSVGAYEAKTHLSRLLDEVAKGEIIIITKHGQPIARLVPAVEESRDVAQTISELRAWRKGLRLDGLSLRELLEEGRR